MRRLSLLLVFLLTLVAPVHAQTLNATSLSAAATATATSLTVASGSGISAGHLAFIDHETLTITAVSGATLTVQRGRAGLAGAHGAGAAVYTGPPTAFFVTPPPSDNCLTGQSANPYINISTAKVFVCANGYWQSLNDLPPMGAAGTVLVSNGAGAAPSAASSGAALTAATLTTLTATTNSLAFQTQLPDVDSSTYTPVAAGAGAGNVNNGAHSYKFTVEDYGGGETACGAATPTVTITDKTMDGKVTVAVPYIDNTFWPVLSIYRTAAGGSTYKLVARREYEGDVTYTDNTADASLGATCPTTNTTLNTRLTINGSVITVPESTLYDDRLFEWAPRGNTRSIMFHTNDVDSGSAPPFLLAAGSSGSGAGGLMDFRGGNGRGTGKGGDVVFGGGWGIDSGNGGDLLLHGGYAFGAGTGGRTIVQTSLGEATATFNDDKTIAFASSITATSLNKVAITAPASNATLTVANGKTLTASNTLTLAGTDSTVMTFPSTSATVARTDAANAFTGAQTATVSVAAPKLLGSGSTPAVTNTSSNSCGTSAATIVGKDLAGKVTVGATSGTSCTVTFATAWSNAPACTVMNETTANLARATSTTTTVILAGVFVAGDVLAYHCLGY